MQAQPTPYITPEEYLVIEQHAECRSEYWNGEIFAMAGASESHNTIVANLTFLFVGQFKGRDCKVYSTDQRVKVSATGLYTYPDIVVVCGRRKFDDAQQQTFLNPTVLVEVLSPSTEAYDRGEKFEHYRTLESLTDYLLVSQSKPKIEHFIRQADDQWILSESHGRDDSISITSISCILPLAEVYDKVEFAIGKEFILQHNVSIVKGMLDKNRRGQI